MEKIILDAQKREELGKSKVNKVRKKGLIPAVCYRAGKESISIKIKMKDFADILHTKAGENVLITLKISEDKSPKDRVVIIKEIQRDPVKEDIIHVDFNEISLTEKIKVKVPVAMRGEAKEVVSEGGVIEHAIWEVDVECLPTQIPEKIEADVSGMKINDTVFIKDLKVPEGVKILNDPELVILTAKPPAKEEAKVEVPGEEMIEPEVIEKVKKEEEEEAAEEEKGQPKKEVKEEKPEKPEKK